MMCCAENASIVLHQSALLLLCHNSSGGLILLSQSLLVPITCPLCVMCPPAGQSRVCYFSVNHVWQLLCTAEMLLEG